MQLYTINNIISINGNTVQANVSINPSSAVFKGHFPERPILPGVFHLKIVMDILIKYYNKNFVFHACTNIKFLNLIDPKIVNNLIYEIYIKNIHESSCTQDIIVRNDQTVFCKMQNLHVEGF